MRMSLARSRCRTTLSARYSPWLLYGNGRFKGRRALGEDGHDRNSFSDVVDESVDVLDDKAEDGAVAGERVQEGGRWSIVRDAAESRLVRTLVVTTKADWVASLLQWLQ